MTHKSHVKFISFNATMLNGSLGEEEGGGGGKTALIDQRAVAAGKNCQKSYKTACYLATLKSVIRSEVKDHRVRPHVRQVSSGNFARSRRNDPIWHFWFAAAAVAFDAFGGKRAGEWRAGQRTTK